MKCNEARVQAITRYAADPYRPPTIVYDRPERHVWRRSWRERLFGTVPLKKCECGRVCWMDRGEKRYRWTA